MWNSRKKIFISFFFYTTYVSCWNSIFNNLLNNTKISKYKLMLDILNWEIYSTKMDYHNWYFLSDEIIIHFCKKTLNFD